MLDSLKISAIAQNVNDTLSSPVTISCRIESQSLDSLFASMNTVCQHTATNLGIAEWDKWIAFSAAAVTILAFFVAMYELINIWNTRLFKKNCRTLILQDLMRHLFVNIGITELIRIRMSEEKRTYTTHYPEEGVLLRFKFLPNDYDFHKFSSNSALINVIHEVELLMRNYNIAVDITCKHFTNPQLDKSFKENDLNTITNRAIKLIQKLNNLSNQLNTQHFYCRWMNDKIKTDTIHANLIKQLNNLPTNTSGITFPKRNIELTDFLSQHQLEQTLNQYIKLRYDEKYVDILPF